jgi:hypothetical protein
MRPIPTTLLALAIAATIASPAFAVHRLNLTPHFPIEHQAAARFQDQPAPPYPMNYADEAAQTLGISHGRWDAFETKTGDADNPYMPSLKGGIDGRGAMLRLQWTPGR